MERARFVGWTFCVGLGLGLTGCAAVEEGPRYDERCLLRVHFRPDITLARQTLGWEPKVSIEDGLKATIDYFRHFLFRAA